VQRTLNQYYATNVLVEDGIMGDETHRILKWFQKSNGLPETGTPDPSVMTTLNKLLADRTISQGPVPFEGEALDPRSTTGVSGDYRTGIQSTSMYSPHTHYTDSFGAWVLPDWPEGPEGYWWT
jgi:peptidoglycan hydrolase-like protein with peptidoglycan-binding domain